MCTGSGPGAALSLLVPWTLYIKLDQNVLTTEKFRLVSISLQSKVASELLYLPLFILVGWTGSKLLLLFLFPSGGGGVCGVGVGVYSRWLSRLPGKESFATAGACNTRDPDLISGLGR